MNSETASELPDVYIISLKRATARRERMEREAEALRAEGYPGNIVFVDAVDAARDEHLRFPQYSRFLAEVAGLPLSAGERACYASHYLVWEKCAAMPDKIRGGGIIVLEDDVVLDRRAFASAAAKCVRSPWDCVRLFVKDNFPFRRIDGDFFTRAIGGGGTQGYYLRPRAARKFLRASRKWLHPVDLFMNRYWENGVAYVVLRPFPLKEQGDESAIDASDGGGRARTRRARWARPLREIYRFVNNFKKRSGRRKFSRLFFNDPGAL